jgi:EAL domain-containing protein (putative c-di-GMP-specific phosphodiesterase class I)
MNIQKDHKTLAVVSSIIFLAKKLNIKIISEGIETAAEKQIMQELGSEYAQGYLFSKPVTFNEFLSLLS